MATLLGKLRKAVQKIKFLLNLSVNRWKVASIIGNSSSKRRLSFNDGDCRPGLAACEEDSGSGESPRSSRRLQRTASYPSEDDVDKRADAFIAIFYKQLQFEKQISLQLRVCAQNREWLLGARRCMSQKGEKLKVESHRIASVRCKSEVEHDV